ncbi:ATP synthase F1 subunit delta [Amphibacillus indicireducens]|uniref:ATP synthase subunit delta n=1 Tax=Amphibacillus indicireducens TaxID=1076330 RepID=A0ABP7VQQ4_9BACI
MAKLNERYANALLELSDETGNLEADLNQTILVRDLFKAEDRQAFLTHPNIANSAKYELFESAFSGKISKHLMGFLFLMVQKNRESLIVPALTEFINRANRRLGKTEARVVSAKPLNQNQIESIRTLLTKQTNMDVEIKHENDPDVIGGFYILIDGKIFDGTVRTKLNVMKDRLKRGGYQ